MFCYSINAESEVPVYRQLVDQINAQIRSGALETGAQLPTVREMAEHTGLSCGTVKRVYDCLREMGDIEMTRRRGSFVKYVREDQSSRKYQAMTAIDRMIRQLSELNFSPSEIQIFLNLKLREWGLKWSGIHLALVTDMDEFAPILEAQLSRIPNAKVIVCSLRQFREYPYSIDEEADVILASPEDSQQLLPVLPDRNKLVKLAFAPSFESISAIFQLRGRVAAICDSEICRQLLVRCLPELTCFRSDALSSMPSALDGASAVVAPKGWREEELREALKEKYLPFEYVIDEGSMIYLEERINRVREERQLRPGTLSF